MKWIDINVDKPPSDLYVMITDGKIIVTARLDDDRLIGFDAEYIWAHNWEWSFMFDDITHWMLLPEPPKDE